MARRISLFLALALLSAGCAYESSGTTTTTEALPGDEPVPTSPADITAIDQRTEGSSVMVESVSLPAAGWVVARLDSGGSPGEVIGISEVISKGLSLEVLVPFLVPVAEETAVHLTVHVDVNGDGEFLYEPPDLFVDSVATRANGEAATTIITLGLLPPLSPASALLDSQVSDGSSVVVAGGLLPAPGYFAIHADADGQPGEVLGVSDLLPAGEAGAVTVALDAPLAATGPFHAVAWVDRDEDGVFTPGPEGDQMAVTEEGLLAAATATITVLRREPGRIQVANQTVTDGSFVISSLQAPSAGFLEILSNSSGAPGNRLSVVAVPAGASTALEVDLPNGVGSGARVWLRLWIDFDQSGTLSDADLVALDEFGGQPVEVSFVVTLG